MLLWHVTPCSLVDVGSQQVPPKRFYLSTKLHDVKTQKTIILIPL